MSGSTSVSPLLSIATFASRSLLRVRRGFQTRRTKEPKGVDDNSQVA